MAWFWRFAAFSIAAILAPTSAVAGTLWCLGDFQPGALGLHGVRASALGLAASASVGVGLMAPVFSSARRARDDVVAAGDGQGREP